MLNWSEVETVLLDMDGTLLDLHFDNYFWQEHLPARFAEIKSIDPHLAKHQIQEQTRSIQGTLLVFNRLLEPYIRFRYCPTQA